MSTDISEDGPMENPLWRFSLAVYDRAVVKSTCLALQDRTGADVNILLFLCWLDHTGRPMPDDAALRRIIRTTAPLRDDVVAPLRAVRRNLDPAKVQALRNAILNAELVGEQMIQALLHARFTGDSASSGALQDTQPDTLREAVLCYLVRCGGTQTVTDDLGVMVDTLIAEIR